MGRLGRKVRLGRCYAGGGCSDAAEEACVREASRLLEQVDLPATCFPQRREVADRLAAALDRLAVQCTEAAETIRAAGRQHGREDN